MAIVCGVDQKERQMERDFIINGGKYLKDMLSENVGNRERGEGREYLGEGVVS